MIVVPEPQQVTLWQDSSGCYHPTRELAALANHDIFAARMLADIVLDADFCESQEEAMELAVFLYSRRLQLLPLLSGALL